MAYSQTISFTTTLVSALQKYLKETPVTQDFTRLTALSMLEKKSKAMDAPSYWRVPVKNIGSPLGGPFEGAGTTATTGFDDITHASFRRAQYAHPVVLLRTDEWDTNSEVALFKAGVQKVESARQMLRKDVSTDLLSTSAVTNGVQGIPLAAEEAPGSSGAYGGLDGATETYWKNKTDATNPAFSTAGMAAFESMFRQLASVEGREGNPFDWILVSTAVFGYLQTAARTFLSLNAPATGGAGKRAGEMGFPTMSFHGKPIVFDPGLTAGYAYFWADDAAYLVTQPGVDFTMPYEWVSLAPAGQHGLINHVYWRGQLVVEQRAALGQISTITA